VPTREAPPFLPVVRREYGDRHDPQVHRLPRVPKRNERSVAIAAIDNELIEAAVQHAVAVRRKTRRNFATIVKAIHEGRRSKSKATAEAGDSIAAES
jgi:hypothetical protein